MNTPLQAIETFLTKADAPEKELVLQSLASLSLAVQKEVSDLGLILSDFSARAAIEYFRVVPDLLKCIPPEELGGWIGMGIQIAQHSSASGIRYFREGADLFSKIPNAKARVSFIQLGMTLAQRDPNRALVYYQQAPSFLADVTTDLEPLLLWAEYGMTLEDYTLAVEYFRTTPDLLRYLPMPLLAQWIKTALRFSASKLFFGITFIRISPEIFSKIAVHQSRMLQFIDDAAQIDADQAISLFKEYANILSAFPASLTGFILEKAIQMALVDFQAARALLVNSPKVVREMGADSFPEWVEHGINLLPNGKGVAYFSFESMAAKGFAKQCKGGVYLSDCAHVLESFARGLSGRPVTIRPNEEADIATTDGQTIYLPPHYASFPDPIQNFEWYKLATAFQAGYLEFGTYAESERPGHVVTGERTASLPSFLQSFLHPTWIKQFFDIVEGARVEFLLKEEYLGLREPLSRMREEELKNRPSIGREIGTVSAATGVLGPFGMLDASSLQMITELLLQISLAGKTKGPIPSELVGTVFECCRMMGAVQNPHATVIDSMKAAASVYEFLIGNTPLPDLIDKPMEPFDGTGEQEKGVGVGSGKIKPSVRGAIDPAKVAKKAGELLFPEIKGNDLVVANAPARGANSPQTYGAGEQTPLPETQSVSSEGMSMIFPRQPTGDVCWGLPPYDEWDCEADDYRPGFCRVVEKMFPRSQDNLRHEEAFVEQVLSEYSGMIKSITRQFQYLAPEQFVLHKGVLEGEIIDWDRLIENCVEQRAGLSPSGRVYSERRKKERSVATALLVDFSGSTQQRLPCGKSILQIEKEALILLSHAINATGDRFALYGFSGRGNDAVDFYVLKDFASRLTREIDCSIGRANALAQNRDGAAIRHATSKLADMDAQTRILILLTDGKPLDDGYNGSYAIADTKMALREARKLGINPFCITVDKEGAEYLKGMYGDVSYLVVDQIESLPKKLPLIYKRLTT